MNISNKFRLEFLSLSQNESFARSVVACFVLQLNPSVSQLADIKTAVSEAVTNSIVHAYPNGVGEIVLEAELLEDEIHINIYDNGVGIDNLTEALEPFYTTKPNDERSGMGFTIMKSFMDSVRVVSEKDKGTQIYMSKKISLNKAGVEC
jgi:stage II sporulation protein AB (anti-sigma F factor)